MKRTPWTSLAIAAGIGALILKNIKTRPVRGKVVLITGGSRGLGLEIARRCLDRGARVAIFGRDSATLERAKDAIGHDILTFSVDVADEKAVNAACDSIRKQWGAIDVLIHNAGTISVGPARTMDINDYRHHMDTHFFGALNAVHAVLPQMRERKQGNIVLISSVGAKIAVPHLLPYDASKFALAGYAEGLHAELANDGICVTHVVPFLMRTGSPRNADFKGQHQKEYGWFALLDSLPFVSLSARRVARQIVSAFERGRAELFLVPFGRPLLISKILLPELFAAAVSVGNWLLPRSEGAGTESHKGYESESELTRSRLTELTRRAEERNNQRAEEPDTGFGEAPFRDPLDEALRETFPASDPIAPQASRPKPPPPVPSHP
jgi:NADP-dependent 3-hydroxy acid dehydrogenase YdfG